MSSPIKTPRRRRLRGRLGLDLAAQSPALPPIDAKTSTRHVGLDQQQADELQRLRDAFIQRIHASHNLTDLSPLQSAVVRAAHTSTPAADGMDDCFSAAKAFADRIHTIGHAPFLSQFLLDVVTKIEQIVHDKRQQEANSIHKLHGPRPHPNNQPEDQAPSSSSSSDEQDEDNSDDEASDDGVDAVHTETTSSATPIAPEQPPPQNLRHVPPRAKFRTTLHSRQFPPSRVAASEFITSGTTYMPFDHLKRPVDVAALKLRGHNESGSAQWAFVVFPKARPSITSQDEVDAFVHWARTKQLSLSTVDVSTEDFADAKSAFAHALATKEAICFELSRFVFDQCPTTARFLLGLFNEVVGVAQRTLANAERQQQILTQRHRNVQLELTRLRERQLKVESSLVALQTTLQRRQQMVLRERELIIRKRKKLSLLLCADQVLLRRVASVIHYAQDLADDVIQSEAMAVATGRPLVPAAAYHVEDKFTTIEELIELILGKYGVLPPVATARQSAVWLWPSTESQSHFADQDKANKSEKEDEQTPHSSVGDATKRTFIVLDTSDVKTAVDEYKATLLRLMRMLSSKSPDSSIGWDPQELWDQALFLPPHEEVQDLERDVQSLCLEVEDRVLQQRRRHTDRGSRCHVAVQTELRSCMTNSYHSAQRWRPRAFAPPPVSSSPSSSSSSSPPTVAIPRWRWRRRHPRHHGRPPSTPASTLLADAFVSSTTVVEDHRDLLQHVVPEGFRAYIRAVPSDYTPHQLSLPQVHSVISYLLNSVWMLVQADFHRPLGFSPTSTTHAQHHQDVRLIPLTPFHAYVYRLFLQHFHLEAVVTRRLLDVLVSVRHLDTQSNKVQLFCRLLGMPGVPTFPSDGFWFVLKALHVLQRCCGSSGHYFLLDAAGDNEFVPQASATDALGQLFAGASNEVHKRLRLKLSGLASVYGTVWIPAYSVLTCIMDEWQLAQDALRALVEHKLFLEHASEADPFTGIRICSDDTISFREFLQGFEILQLHVNRTDAAQAYRQLVQDSVDASHGKKATLVDRHRFYANWMAMILHAVNVSQQQMLRAPVTPSSSSSSSSGGVGARVQLGAISDAMALANQQLAHKFLRTSWEPMKAEVIRRLDAKFHDVGLQVRLVQQMEATLHAATQGESSPRHTTSGANEGPSAWTSLQRLIHIAYTPNVVAVTSSSSSST